MYNRRILYTIYFSVFLFSVFVLIFIQTGIPPIINIDNILKASLSAFAPSFLFTVFFRRVAWRWQIFQRLISLKIPVVHGRWTGFILSSFDKHSTRYPVRVEFNQTLDEITSTYFDKNAIHHSLIAHFYLKPEFSSRKLIFVYQNDPIVTRAEELRSHIGVMELYVDSEGKRMKGTYFNNPRERNTYGEIVLSFKSRNFLGRF